MPDAQREGEGVELCEGEEVVDSVAEAHCDAESVAVAFCEAKVEAELCTVAEALGDGLWVLEALREGEGVPVMHRVADSEPVAQWEAEAEAEAGPLGEAREGVSWPLGLTLGLALSEAPCAAQSRSRRIKTMPRIAPGARTRSAREGWAAPHAGAQGVAAVGAGASRWGKDI